MKVMYCYWLTLLYHTKQRTAELPPRCNFLGNDEELEDRTKCWILPMQPETEILGSI